MPPGRPAVHMAKFPARRMKLQKSLETRIFCELARFEREESVKRKWNNLLRSAMSNESGEKKGNLHNYVTTSKVSKRVFLRQHDYFS